MGVRLGQTQQRMDTWMRLESRFTKQMSQLFPPSPSFRHHSSPGLPHGRFGSLYRFNGSSGIHTRKETPRRKTDRQTNGDGETKDSERKKPRQEEEKKQTKAHYFTDTNGNYEGSREKRWRVKRTEATTRGGVVGCGQICCGGWFLLDLYFINYLRSRAHTPRTRIQTRVTLSCPSILTPSKPDDF